MNHLVWTFILVTLVGCRPGKAPVENVHSVRNDARIVVCYHCPENYPKILSKMVYFKTKDKAPFAIDPDEPHPGVNVCTTPLDDLRDLGFSFPPGNQFTYNSPSRELLYVADSKAQEDLVAFHKKLGIKIVKVE